MKANLRSSLLTTSILSLLVFAGVAQAQTVDVSSPPPKIVYGNGSKNAKNAKKKVKVATTKNSRIDAQVGPYVTATNSKSKVKAEPKLAAKTDVKADAKATSKVEPKVAAKTDVKADAKVATKVESKTAAKVEVKAAAKTDAKADAKIAAKPAVIAKEKPAAKPAVIVEQPKVTSTDRSANSQLPSVPVVPAAKNAETKAPVSALKTKLDVKPVSLKDLAAKLNSRIAPPVATKDTAKDTVKNAKEVAKTAKQTAAPVAAPVAPVAAPAVKVGEPAKVVTVVPNKVTIVKDTPVKAEVPKVTPAKVVTTQVPAVKKTPVKIVTVAVSPSKKTPVRVSDAKIVSAHANIARRNEVIRHQSKFRAIRMDRAGIITNFCITKTKHPGACLNRSIDRAWVKLENEETRLLNCGQLRKSEAGGDAGVETFVTSHLLRLRTHANVNLKKELASNGHITRAESREISLRAMLKHSRNLQRFADKVCDAKEFDALYAAKGQAKVRSGYSPEQTSKYSPEQTSTTSSEVRSTERGPIDLLPPGLFSKAAQ